MQDAIASHLANSNRSSGLIHITTCSLIPTENIGRGFHIAIQGELEDIIVALVETTNKYELPQIKFTP